MYKWIIFIIAFTSFQHIDIVAQNTYDNKYSKAEDSKEKKRRYTKKKKRKKRRKRKSKSSVNGLTMQERLALEKSKLKVNIYNQIPKDTLLKETLNIASLTKIDSLWMRELYNNSLYDTIYKLVTDPIPDTPITYNELPTDTLKNRLKTLNERTPFNIEYNPDLERVIKRYLKQQKEPFEKLMGLSHFFFPLFEQELDNANIPLEIKYLSIVESALKPKAKSRVGATGLWQFMYNTGRTYGLKVSSYVDERMDPIRSTKAACKYLSKLYGLFGDWDLALASYNAGPGNVTKAIRRSNGRTNYWNIRHRLPRETAGYVPAFLATMYIFEYAEEHGFKPIKPKYRYFQTDTIKIRSMISLKQLSNSLDVSLEELKFLNPSYKLNIIPHIKGKDYMLRLPIQKIGNFLAQEEALYAQAKEQFEKREKPLVKYFSTGEKIRYRVRSGDYLGKIAKKYRVSVSQIKKWNKLRSNNIKLGQRLTIYPRKLVSSTKKNNNSRSNSSSSTALKNAQIYTVKSGDTLWSIAKRFKGVSIDNLKTWNKISGTGIKPGMKLKLYK